MEKNEQIKRIELMEKRYDRLCRNVNALERALSTYIKLQPELKELTNYYDSGLWREDYSDDNEGLIPDTVKRGVLSEDSIFDLLTDIEGLKEMMISLHGNEE